MPRSLSGPKKGGYFHGRNHLTYGVDIRRIRWMGVLQRISIGYLLASTLEIWFVCNVAVDSAVAFAKKYYYQWVVTLLLGLLYMSLLYGLYVPNWAFESSSMKLTSSVAGHESVTQTCDLTATVSAAHLTTTICKKTRKVWNGVDTDSSIGVHAQVLAEIGQQRSLHGGFGGVQCGGSGNLQPPCNAVGLIDRLILGEQHLYQHPVYRRTKECSVNSPDYGPLPPSYPGWCLAPFDPEGILSSLMAAITCFAGLHYGHIIVHFKANMQRIILWSMSSFPLLISGYVLQVLGVPLSKPLYTLSYMCITAGASGFLLTFIFYVVDVKNIRKPTMVLQWMGMNALIIYALAACDLFPAALQGFYWHSPENNL
ncbi:hypothetical protein RJ639_046925, partial [Escallonia herrerae]